MQNFYSRVNAGFVYSLFTFLLFANQQKSAAQQIPQVSQFMFNQLIYNPAAAGMQETDFNTNLLTRFQWSSVDGAPVTNMFWADYKFSEKKMVVGLNFNHDRYGANRNTDVFANYAYYVPLSHKFRLAMGLRLGATFNRFNVSDLKNVWDADDPLLATADRSSVLPKAGTGFQLISKDLYIGLALPDLLIIDNDDIYDNKDKSFFGKKRNYLLTGGYRLKINDSYNLFPNLRLNYFPESGVTVDANVIAEITDYFWAGLTYSTANSFTAMAGTHISSRIRFGYAYEFKPKSETSARLNTHEINLMINLDDLFRKNK